ncbi:MAG TPA: hypothetical protein VGR47_07700 [Terracidiphilus sp.]|nr:hypothetical protein [Terracidiphilus sp.]
MDDYITDEADAEQDPLEAAERAFAEQLLACLEECARGRRGLFSDYEDESGEEAAGGWPEAARLRDLAAAMQGAFARMGRRNALADEFLDLCSIHGESHPGERRLARAFLERIERGAVGSAGEEERKPWG